MNRGHANTYKAFFSLPYQITNMFNALANNKTALPILDQQAMHLNTLIQNLSWNIPELEELLNPNTPPWGDANTGTPTTNNTETQPTTPHDNIDLNTTTDTENMEEVSTPICEEQHIPLGLNITEIPANIQL